MRMVWLVFPVIGALASQVEFKNLELLCILQLSVVELF